MPETIIRCAGMDVVLCEETWAHIHTERARLQATRDHLESTPVPDITHNYVTGIGDCFDWLDTETSRSLREAIALEDLRMESEYAR